uniref:Si:ch211-48m9.1 n=1 Tax=Hucho hucho TaxID=62062 RepID=A0A4W5PGT5_9TELE
ALFCEGSSTQHCTRSSVSCQLSKKECVKYGGSLVGNTCKYVPDLALMSFILFFGTYSMTVSLKKFKFSRYFPTKLRKLISDFSIFMAIMTFVGLDRLIGLKTPKLIVPTEFKPTRPDRGWIVLPFGKNPWWVYLASFVPALLVTILIFMDQQISAVIVNRKENKLRKGCGYHLDLFWVGVLMAVCSFLGLPWEQRLTGILVFVLTGVSIFLAPILQFIPMPVLYGVFLYMGVASLSGIQFWERIKLYMMPSKYQPDFPFLRHVPLRRVHLFTLVQIICLAVLWVLKSTVLAILFPVMILGLLVVRKMLDMVFSQHDLAWIDDILPGKDKKKDKKKKGDKDDMKKKDKKKGRADDSKDKVRNVKFYCHQLAGLEKKKPC